MAPIGYNPYIYYIISYVPKTQITMIILYVISTA